MIIAVDTETEGLDATKFQMGCIAYEDESTESHLRMASKKIRTEIYYKKENMWKRILYLAEKEKKRGHHLYVYGHNHQFDFIGYANYTDKNLKYCSFNPFIVYYTFQGSKTPDIYFLDSYALSKLPLKDLGNTIGKQKKETPQFVKDGTPWINDMEKRNIVKTYCENDTKIVIEYIRWLKEHLKQHGYSFRRLISASQIGTYFLINEIAKKYNRTEDLFYDPKKTILHDTYNKTEIHKAYRGGMIRAFCHGNYENTTMIDYNSLYPSKLMEIPIPNLRTETRLEKPEYDEIKNKMGIAKILLRKKPDYGMIGTRYKNNLIFPTQESYILGTYTIAEINEAVKDGADLIAIEYAVTYEKMENYLQEMITTFYNKRKETDHNDFFYKLVLNSMIGKLGQHREAFTLVFDELYNKDDYKANGYEIAGIYDDMGAYRKNGKTLYNKFYCPIIPAYVNAYGRMELYKGLKKIPYYDLLYCDTDSIMFNNPKHLKNFDIGEELGQWKILHENVSARIYGKKMYSVAEEVKVAGVSKGQFKEGELNQRFKEGKITNKRMIGLNAHGGTPGKFEEFELDLTKSMNEHIILKDETDAQRVFIDEKETDISFFLEDIKRITKSL